MRQKTVSTGCFDREGGRFELFWQHRRSQRPRFSRKRSFPPTLGQLRFWLYLLSERTTHGCKPDDMLFAESEGTQKKYCTCALDITSEGRSGVADHAPGLRTG